MERSVISFIISMVAIYVGYKNRYRIINLILKRRWLRRIAVAWVMQMPFFRDTYVGATVQVKYRCQDCQTVTEKIEHCGNVTIKDRGYRIFNNESVNLLCTVVAPLFFFALVKGLC